MILDPFPMKPSYLFLQVSRKERLEREKNCAKNRIRLAKRFLIKWRHFAGNANIFLNGNEKRFGFIWIIHFFRRNFKYKMERCRFSKLRLLRRPHTFSKFKHALYHLHALMDHWEQYLLALGYEPTTSWVLVCTANPLELWNNCCHSILG